MACIQNLRRPLGLFLTQFLIDGVFLFIKLITNFLRIFAQSRGLNFKYFQNDFSSPRFDPKYVFFVNLVNLGWTPTDIQTYRISFYTKFGSGDLNTVFSTENSKPIYLCTSYAISIV